MGLLPPRVSDPDMHHGTCVTHVTHIPGSLTSGFFWSRRWGKTFPAFPAHAQPVILPSWQETHERITVVYQWLLCPKRLNRSISMQNTSKIYQVLSETATNILTSFVYTNDEFTANVLMIHQGKIGRIAVFIPQWIQFRDLEFAFLHICQSSKYSLCLNMVICIMLPYILGFTAVTFPCDY